MKLQFLNASKSGVTPSLPSLPGSSEISQEIWKGLSYVFLMILESIFYYYFISLDLFFMICQFFFFFFPLNFICLFQNFCCCYFSFLLYKHLFDIMIQKFEWINTFPLTHTLSLFPSLSLSLHSASSLPPTQLLIDQQIIHGRTGLNFSIFHLPPVERFANTSQSFRFFFIYFIYLFIFFCYELKGVKCWNDCKEKRLRERKTNTQILPVP